MLRKTIKLKKLQFLSSFMRIKCPECGSNKIANGMGEVVCRKCGFVIEDSIVVSC
jgi:ribosomal protein S27E